MSINTRLSPMLAELYPSENAAAMIMADVGIEARRIQLAQPPSTRWFFIVSEADKAGLIPYLLDKALTDYPTSKELRLLRAELNLAEATSSLSLQPSALPLLVAAIGSDPSAGSGQGSGLSLDLAALRAVRTHTGQPFIRILDATLAKLRTVLDRERAAGRRANVHLAVHSGPQGVLLGGEVVGPVELSEILDGVQVLLIAGCSSDRVADFLHVVPVVVSFSEDVEMGAASEFSRNWWTAIAMGLTPDNALGYAVGRSPAGMGEMVVKGW